MKVYEVFYYNSYSQTLLREEICVPDDFIIENVDSLKSLFYNKIPSGSYIFDFHFLGLRVF